MDGGRFVSSFWLRQVVNGLFWWVALGAAGEAMFRGGNVFASVTKAVAFVALAAFVTWKFPPYTAGLSPLWWGRFVLALGLWLAALDRFWNVVADGWRAGSVPFSAIGSAMVFALVVGVVGWFVLPRETVVP